MNRTCNTEMDACCGNHSKRSKLVYSTNSKNSDGIEVHSAWMRDNPAFGWNKIHPAWVDNAYHSHCILSYYISSSMLSF